jgi:hypothetical protein
VNLFRMERVQGRDWLLGLDIALLLAYINLALWPDLSQSGSNVLSAWNGLNGH